jgi:hypothetical protein
MGNEPRILAAFVQGTLETAQKLEQERNLAVTSQVADETLARIGSAIPVAWLPVRFDIELTNALFQAAGTEGATRVFREAVGGSMHKSFLGPLVKGAVSLLGRSPERLLRWTSKVWMTIYRDAGELVLTEADVGGSARLELVRPPEILIENTDYLRGLAAGIEGGLAALGTETTCRLDSGGASPSFTVTWKSAR